MIKNLAGLKKVQIGDKLRLIYRFGKLLDEIKEIGKVQTNAIAFKKGDGLSYLELPPASLLEFTEKGFKIYGIGTRDLTPKEKEVYDNRPIDPKQAEIDAYSDGNTMFYREKSYYQEKGMMHLTCYNKGKHMVWDENNIPKIKDPAVKGELNLEYIFE
jgi:hypothetical protein